MPRQAEPIFPEDQPPGGGMCKPIDSENHAGRSPTPEKPKKSKHHSTKSSINNPAGDKEKYIKAKSTKNKNESSEFINSKLPSNVVSQPENLNKGDSFKNEIVTEKCKHEHGKKRRKHSKGESKHEKRSRRDEVNSEVTVELPHVKEPTRKHKHHDKSHGSSHLPKTSTTYGKPPRPNKSVAYEDACHQTISASLREKSNEADIHASSPYEPVPGTPSSVSGCSSHLSRSSSCSRSPLRSSRHQRRLVHDSHCNEKSYKQKYERSSRSPSIHFTHDRKPEHHRSANNAQDNNLEEKYNTNKRTQQSVSPPSKPKRYDSALTYGYRQSTQRRHLSPRHRSHSRRHAPHRERSRSDSERFDSRKTAYRPGDKERVHQKTFHTKVKPRFYNPDENTDVRKSHGSKNIDHHSTRDSHSTRRRSSGSHRRDLHEDIESLSPSPKRSDGKYEPRNLYTRQQAYNLSKCHSDPHSPPAQKQDRQGDAHEVLDSGSPNRKLMNNLPVCIESTHLSPPSTSLSHPKDKERKPRPFQALCELFDELKCEDVSDTELHLIIPSSMITFSSDTVIGHNNERTSSSESPYPTNNNDNTSAQQLDTEKIENGVNNRPSKTDINITVDSLEALSTQIRQQMSGAENWDVNDLGDPIELEEEYSSNTIDQSNPGLLESTKSDGSLYTPWQELIESAGRKASPVSNKFDVEDYVQCVGTSIAGIGHRDIIPVRKRTNGLDVLRRTGVSRKYFESNLLKHLTANSSSEELTENNTCDVAKFPDIWANGSEYSCCGILNQLSKLVLPLSRKTDGYLRQDLLRTVKCT